MDVKEILDTNNSGSVVNTVPSTSNIPSEHEYLDEPVRVYNVYSECQSQHDQVPCRKCSIACLPHTMFMAHQILSLWCIVSRWV